MGRGDCGVVESPPMYALYCSSFSFLPSPPCSSRRRRPPGAIITSNRSTPYPLPLSLAQFTRNPPRL